MAAPALRLCVGDEQNTGAWQPASGTVSEAPCCGINPDHFRRAHPACGKDMMPTAQFRLVFRGRTDHLAHTGGFGCTCSGFVNRLEWRPAGCRLIEWDATRFCDALGPRRLLFIGDSTSEQAASVLMNAVLWDARRRSRQGCQRQIFAASSDTLVKQGSMGRQRRGAHFGWYVRHLRADVVVLSAGAHVYDSNTTRGGGEERFRRLLRDVWHQHQRHFPNVTLLWKTQQPGGCGARPLSALPSSIPNYWPAYRHSGHAFNWPTFERRDRIAKAFWRERGVAVVDLEPLHYRVDAHISSPGTLGRNAFSAARNRTDCLHLCVPGPLSLLPRLLLHMIASRQLVLPRRRPEWVPTGMPTGRYNPAIFGRNISRALWVLGPVLDPSDVAFWSSAAAAAPHPGPRLNTPCVTASAM